MSYVSYMGSLQSKSLEDAFTATPREYFLPGELKDAAGYDIALPIGFGQTNSQPSTVANMLAWLDVGSGQKVLDIGSGSGWTTALLSHIIGPEGFVYAVELVPELVGFGRENCENIGIRNAKFCHAGDILGLPKYAPYDRILVSAAAEEFPREILWQLKIGGKIVIPVGSDILEITKLSKTRHETTKHPGYVFVPLLTTKSSRF